MNSVMLLNGQERSDLAITRSFGRKGIEVIVGGNRKLSRSFFSKYCTKHFIYPSSTVDDMHRAILSKVQDFKPTVLLASGHNTTYTVLANLEEYKKHCKIAPLPSLRQFNEMNDKASMTKKCEKLGSPVPKTYYPSIKDIRKLSKQISYPVLIKPRIASYARGIQRADSPAELVTKYSHIASQKPAAGFDCLQPIVQDYIPTDITYSVDALFDTGRHIASVVKKSLRHYPIPYGSPVANTTVQNEEMRQIVIRLLTDLNWNGPAVVQLMIDPRDATAKIIEVNPRLGATVDSSIQAGINIPYMMYQMALKKKVRPLHYYTTGQEYRWLLFGEIVHILRQKKIAREYCLKKIKTEIDLTDIKPHMAQVIDLIKNGSVT